MAWLDKPTLALSLLIASGPLLAGEAPPLAPPTLSADTTVATAGYYRLSWTHPGMADSLAFELQESPTADFTAAETVYQGPDRATSHSGRTDGDYHFRVRALTGESASAWSAPVTVQVRHHSLLRAGLFFALGALVFIATLALILRGARPERQP